MQLVQFLMDFLSPLLSAVLQIWFFGRLLCLRLRLWIFLAYPAAVLALTLFPYGLAILALQLIALFIIGLYHHCPPSLDAVAALVTVALLRVINGCVDAAIGIMGQFPALVQSKAAPYLALLCSLLAFLLLFLSYLWISSHIELNGRTQYALILSIPILLVLFVSGFIGNLYGNVIILDPERGILFPHVAHVQVLWIQAAAYGCILAVLFTFKRLADSVALQTSKAILEQQVHAQEHYLEEARVRYQQTRAFRHDIKSHLSTIDGLLQQGAVEEAKGYLNSLNGAVDALSCPVVSGNAAVDALLSSKLEAIQQGCGCGVHPASARAERC